MNERRRKESGAYYTPDKVAASLVSWVVRNTEDRLIDPSCGDGRFIAKHRNSVGIEQDEDAHGEAVTRAPWALVHMGDFFTWASSTTEHFDCAAGNPPFIRYQSFSGDIRERALELCRKLGATFSGLTSSWAPFLVAAASRLCRGGRMAFVVPAEIGHAPYAAPLVEYLLSNFERVHIIAVREKLFVDLSEDCWLLYAEGFGAATDQIRFTAVDRFTPSDTPPRSGINIPANEWRGVWNRRLRPFLLPGSARELYRAIAQRPDTSRLGDLASVGIGYVSGANDFFHLRPSYAAEIGIPKQFLHATVRNGRALTSPRVTPKTVERWIRADDQIYLLKIPKGASVPGSVARYLDTEDGHKARLGYKCRNRKPWYSVPDVQVPDFFLTYMSGRAASLVRNDAGCTCTNSVHSVRLRKGSSGSQIAQRWKSPFVQLSCELEGHPLGGGMLKLEPREASDVILPSAMAVREIPTHLIADSLLVLQAWRHYASEA